MSFTEESLFLSRITPAKTWKFYKQFKGNLLFWILYHRIKRFASATKYFSVFHQFYAPLFHNSCTFSVWPVALWITWDAFVPCLQVLICLSALRPSFGRGGWYFKTSKQSKISSIQVRLIVYNFLIWIEFHSASINVFLGCKYPKSRKFFLKTNRQVERLSEISFMLQMKVFVQCFMLPKFIASIGLYFITDSGNDALQLPIPMW